MSETSPLLLDYRDFAEATGGEWVNYHGEPPLSGVSMSRESLSQGMTGNLYCYINRVNRRNASAEQHRALLDSVFSQGAVAAVAPRHTVELPTEHPLLLVDDVDEALKAIGRAARKRFAGRCLLVTGTEGKTGFKCMLGHVLSRQISTHFIANSANLDVSIQASLASVRRDDRIALFEASVAQPGRGVRRSLIVRPHLAVITEVGNEHLKYHGSQAALIEAKAGIVEGVVDGGFAILNADSANYAPTRTAVLARRRLPILVFGSASWCNGQLLESRFDVDAWWVKARIEDQWVEYRVPVPGMHVPLASVSVLLAAYYLGADVARAAADLADYRPFKTQGALRLLNWSGGQVRCYDNADRASSLSYQSTLRMTRLLSPLAATGCRVGVIGEMKYMGEEAQAEHIRLAGWLEEAGFDRLILVGPNTATVYAHLRQPEKVMGQFPDYVRESASAAQNQALIDAVMAEVAPGDLLYVKGELDELGDYLRTLEVSAS